MYVYGFMINKQNYYPKKSNVIPMYVSWKIYIFFNKSLTFLQN